MTSYIPDGYTRDDGYIEGSRPNSAGQRLYDALAFTYRPASRMEVVRIDAEIKAAYDGTPESEVKAEKISCKFVASKIVAWDLKSAGVHAVKVSPDACERMASEQFRRLYRIIRNEELSDPKPVEEDTAGDSGANNGANSANNPTPPPSDGQLQGNSVAASG